MAQPCSAQHAEEDAASEALLVTTYTDTVAAHPQLESVRTDTVAAHPQLESVRVQDPAKGKEPFCPSGVCRMRHTWVLVEFDSCSHGWVFLSQRLVWAAHADGT